jgi:4-carboxymuconolactone decarboxylase
MVAVTLRKERPMSGQHPGDSSKHVDTLPAAAMGIAQEHPALWQSFQQLGEQVSLAGPLDERTRHLVHLAYAIGADSEGATHSHVRRALASGIRPEEIDHVALLAVTTMGWPKAMKGLTWVRDITRHDIRSQSQSTGRRPGP